MKKLLLLLLAFPLFFAACSSDDDKDEEGLAIVGNWLQVETYAAKVVSNMPEYNAQIEEHIVNKLRMVEGASMPLISFDAAFNVVEYDDQTMEEEVSRGTYSLEGNILIVSSVDPETNELVHDLSIIDLNGSSLISNLDVKAILAANVNSVAAIREILGEKYDDFKIESAVFIQEYTRVE